MGWKASLVIIQDPSPAIPEEELLQRLGFARPTPLGTTSLDECIYPRDQSINIGYYNGCLILADDYQLTNDLEKEKDMSRLVAHESLLTGLYPDSEILSVACHSVTNYHMYSLVKAGRKVRFKMVAADYALREYGEKLAEEQAIYANSAVVDGVLSFRGSGDESGEYEYTEDQLMEEFTFGMARRLLKVGISMGGDEELMTEVVFSKYEVGSRKVEVNGGSRRNPWWKTFFGRQ